MGLALSIEPGLLGFRAFGGLGLKGSGFIRV